KQAATGLPSSWIAHAPQAPCPQPSLQPVRPSRSRSSSSADSSGPTRSDCGVPLMVVFSSTLVATSLGSDSGWLAVCERGGEAQAAAAAVPITPPLRNPRRVVCMKELATSDPGDHHKGGAHDDVQVHQHAQAPDIIK